MTTRTASGSLTRMLLTGAGLIVVSALLGSVTALAPAGDAVPPKPTITRPGEAPSSTAPTQPDPKQTNSSNRTSNNNTR